MTNDLKERVEYCLDHSEYSYMYDVLQDLWKAYETLKMQTETDKRLPAYERILPTCRQRVIPMAPYLDGIVKRQLAEELGTFMLHNGYFKHKKSPLADTDMFEHVVWFDGLVKKKGVE